ncbi:M20/M25/M40 family metallo-hydrolase [Paraburkholderia caribensis]|uniref:M20/M25/M40 family metallo-hydrolase n=1 Tax=Paraburkholderia caribensis TaxID=75105 RepID=UPI000720462F|nr:M20/M25/M40 family metallo-hydrolase [Paraburkholderia caribensis]ALP68546.1 hypothetical protein AN416_38120 [Paraburkholderia caribensis]AUT57903.1 hypothetical protein C2L66_39095 [Paraburkholderia caribensis]
MRSFGAPVLQAEMVHYSHHLHQHPEAGFEEFKTSAFIARWLEELGLSVRQIGGTGLVASLSCGSGTGAIGLRADMDALYITEAAADRPYTSARLCRMHACGHDGHMAMLLGAVHLHTGGKDFDGTVRFVSMTACLSAFPSMRSTRYALSLYDFNDSILGLGAACFASIVRTRLPA